MTDPELSAILGGAQFFSITFRLFKFDDADEATRLDDNCEDFGEIGVHAPPLDLSTTYPTGSLADATAESLAAA